MANVGLTGSRIRERRLDVGLRQADLAKSVGISPSYLNLIEHNRRRIAGKLLSQIAQCLEVSADQLSRGADSALLDRLRTAAADMQATVEMSRTEEMAGRYPGWSNLIAAQAHRLSSLEERVQILTDRITYDPELAGSLHEVISAVTAIRSAASILVGGETLDADWQGRFHKNIYDDSIRLAASSEALIGYLDAPDADGPAHFAPMDEVESYLSETHFHLADAEGTGPAESAALVAQAKLRSPAARALFAQYLENYQADAALMPLDAFATAARACAYDPIALAARFGAALPQVLRRLATLPSDASHPEMGLAVADASGALLFLKPIDGFAMPRAGAGCPLWPVFSAFSTPGQPIRAEARLPGANAPRFLCYAIASPFGSVGFDAPQVLRATMLVVSDQPAGIAKETHVGVACRICTRTTCLARREPTTIV